MNIQLKNAFRLTAAALTVMQLTAVSADPAWASRNKIVSMKILAINDFHGQIGTGKKVAGRDVGSAPVLAGYLNAAGKGMQGRTIIVSAGDFVGASPADSALLQDEPSIQFFNMLANEECRNRMSRECNLVATIGNHELDEGTDELHRLIYGGNHPNGPFLQTPYKGARFPFIAANVVVASTGKTLLPPYVIKDVDGVSVAFIGAILKQTPDIVAPAGIAGLTFLDEADAINSYISELRAKGVRAIIAVIHQGGFQSGTAISGDIVPIINRLDGEVDVVISGHSHTSLNGLVKNAAGNDVLLTQAFSAGTAFADINLEIDRHSKDIITKSASITTTWVTNIDGTPAVTPDPKVARLVTAADAAVAPMVNMIIGQSSSIITRTQTPTGESALGNLIADAQRAYEGTDFAFMNPGGIRADLTMGTVTWGQLFTIQPFANQMVRMTLTGQQIYDLLAQQWSNTAAPKMLQISGLTYSWALDPATNKGVIIEVQKNGLLLDKNSSYTVTTNNFLSGGGDGFSVFKSGLSPVIDAADIDVLVAYIKTLPQPFNVATDGRITKVLPTAAPATIAKFATFSDPHLYDATNLGTATPEFAMYLAQDRKMIAESGEILTSVIDDLKTRPLDFVLVPGDLTKDGELLDHQLMAAKLGELKAAGKKVFVIPGNHDINNPHAMSFLSSPPTPVATVTPAEFKQIYADFGFTAALYKDPNSLSYIAEPVPGVWLFALDSVQYGNNIALNSPVTAGTLSAATQGWLVDHLNAAKALGKKVIGMQHHGLLEHFTGQSLSFPEYVLQDWQNVSKKVSDNGLNVVFTGHYHANDVTLKDFSTSVLHDVETGSLVTSPSPYRIVDFDITNKTLAITTSTVASIASHPTDFPVYAKNYLQSGMTGIVGYQLSHPPYNLSGPTLAYITSLVVPAFMAHYAGDETPGAVTQATYMGMMGSADPVTVGLGQSLYSLWTDLAPADNKVTFTIGVK
jgi:5'-nucleotidase